MSQYLTFIPLSFLLLIGACQSNKVMTPQTLTETAWELENCLTAKGENLAMGDTPPTMEFGTVQRLGGYSGCNSYGGDYVMKDGKLSAVVMSTKRYCAETAEVENMLFQLLQEGVTVAMDGKNMVLMGANGEKMTFHPKAASADTPTTMMRAEPLTSPTPAAQRFTGTFIYMADAAVFTDCNNGERYAVQVGEGAFQECEKAYRRMGKENAEPALMVVDAVVMDNPAKEGFSKMMKIERLVTGNEKGDCP